MKKFLFLLWLLIAMPSVVYSGEYTDQVRSKFLMAKGLLLSAGWTETHVDRFDKLNGGNSQVFYYTLQANKEYMIMAMGDNDCADLDLRVLDENDNEVGKDTSTDNTPIVEVTPRWTGQFKVSVRMYSCRNNPCYYGICIVGKN